MKTNTEKSVDDAHRLFEPQDEPNIISRSTPTEKAGEQWTPEWLANFGSPENWLQEICEAHNSALAAEREKAKGALHHMEACRALLNVPDDEVLYESVLQLREQLETCTMNTSDITTVHQLREQLYAAVEALKKTLCECQPRLSIDKVYVCVRCASLSRIGDTNQIDCTHEWLQQWRCRKCGTIQDASDPGG